MLCPVNKPVNVPPANGKNGPPAPPPVNSIISPADVTPKVFVAVPVNVPEP